MSKILVGTSGWVYAHWKEVFYPPDLPQSKWFDYYVKFFNAVEINVTFYRNLKKDAFKNWFKNSPSNFYFVVKGNRFITHIKRLKDIDATKNFLDKCLELGNKLGAILWQLPPSFKKDTVRLERFLNKISGYRIKNVFEFRNITWFTEETFTLLKKYNTCLCIIDSPYWPKVKKITANFIYLRFHGRDKLYTGDYSDRELKEWVDFALATKGDIFCFFNNDAFGYAVKNALKFKELIMKN